MNVQQTEIKAYNILYAIAFASIKLFLLKSLIQNKQK